MALPLHSSAAHTHENAQRKPVSMGNPLSGVMGKVDGAIAQAEAFVNKSKMRQAALVFIVAPIVLLVVSHFFMNGALTHGLSALKNPSMTQLMMLPVVAPILGFTLYSAAQLLTRDAFSKKTLRKITRAFRIVLPVVYLFALAWLGCKVFKMHSGLAHGMASGGAGGLYTTAWPFIFTMAWMPFPLVARAAVKELRALELESVRSTELSKGARYKARLEQMRLAAERN